MWLGARTNRITAGPQLNCFDRLRVGFELSNCSLTHSINKERTAGVSSSGVLPLSVPAQLLNPVKLLKHPDSDRRFSHC
jgi:hypothetical protein